MPLMNEEALERYEQWHRLFHLSTTSNREAELERALEAACEEASEDNWDGDGAKAVTMTTRDRAEAFLDALPAGFPEPLIAAEPDGEIAFEWYAGPRRVFSVSVGEGYSIAFAGIFGGLKVHGSEYFLDELPESVIMNVRRLYNPPGA